MTLHERKVDVSERESNGNQPLPVPAGWQIADGTADDIRVARIHPWQSFCLVFANGKTSLYLDYDENQLILDGEKARTREAYCDVLLRWRT